MISSPRLQAVSTILCTELVVPPTIRKACAAPYASAASSSASRMMDTGWHRLSSGFMLLTSTPTHCSPRNFVSSGLPRLSYVPAHQKVRLSCAESFPVLHGSEPCADPYGYASRSYPIPPFVIKKCCSLFCHHDIFHNKKQAAHLHNLFIFSISLSVLAESMFSVEISSAAEFRNTSLLVYSELLLLFH